MNPVLVRIRESKEGTEGFMIVAGQVLRSLELPWRENQRNRSCIPAGEYELKFIKTGRPHGGQYKSYWVKGVPGRTGIIFHSGNWAGDRQWGLRTNSWGCILLGLRVGELYSQRAVLASRLAIQKFHDAMHNRDGLLTVLE